MTYLRKNYDVAHSFAHSLYTEGRNGNYSFSFETDSQGRSFIKSYRTRIGRRILVQPKNRMSYNLFLLSQEKYSVTTSVHQSLLENAVFGKVIKVYSEESLSDTEEAMKKYLSVLNDLLLKFKRARSWKERRYEEVQELYSDIRKYITVFEKDIDLRTIPKVLKKILRDEDIIDSNIIQQLEKNKERELKKKKTKRKKKDKTSHRQFLNL